MKKNKKVSNNKTLETIKFGKACRLVLDIAKECDPDIAFEISGLYGKITRKLYAEDKAQVYVWLVEVFGKEKADLAKSIMNLK